MLKQLAPLAAALVATAAFAQTLVGAELKPVGVIGAAGGSGPLPAVAESVADLRTHVLYHPQKMPRAALPVLLWGNGGCRDNGLDYAQFLREIASQGFFIVSAGFPLGERAIRPPGTAAPAPDRLQGPDGGKTRASDVLAGLDWANRVNSDPKSALYKHLDTSKVGVMGTSCGGLQAILSASDPRVKTAIAFNSGVLLELPATAAPGSDLVTGKDVLPKLKGPIAYINGGPIDIAYLNAQDDFRLIEHVPVFFAENGVGHSGTYLFDEYGGSYARVASAWFSWQLKGDKQAATWFRGADCVLCTRPGWKVKTKHFDGI
jgi:dienelactone hydrolase